MVENAEFTVSDQRRIRRAAARLPVVSRSKFTNDPLKVINGNTAAGRRLRDLYRLAAAELGGKLAMREQLMCVTWARLQQQFEDGDTNPLLVAEVRHAWGRIEKRRRAMRSSHRFEADRHVPLRERVGVGT
jgi:hypothetical protein